MRLAVISTACVALLGSLAFETPMRPQAALPMPQIQEVVLTNDEAVVKMQEAFNAYIPRTRFRQGDVLRAAGGEYPVVVLSHIAGVEYTVLTASGDRTNLKVIGADKIGSIDVGGP